MITVAALVSHPPLMLQELCGEEDPVPNLRAAAGDAARALAGSSDLLVVVGPGDETRMWDAGDGVDARRYGGAGPRICRPALPLSLGVGARLLDEAGWTGPVELMSVLRGIASTDLQKLAGSLSERLGRTGLLVLGDGSARRGPKAPGYVDERAFGWDDAVASALAEGDAAVLAGLDVALAEELMAHGSPAFRLLGEVGLLFGAASQTALTYRGDPYGVTYFTALWHFPDPDQHPRPR